MCPKFHLSHLTDRLFGKPRMIRLPHVFIEAPGDVSDLLWYGHQQCAGNGVLHARVRQEQGEYYVIKLVLNPRWSRFEFPRGTLDLWLLL